MISGAESLSNTYFDKFSSSLVKCKNTLTAPKTTEDEACLKRSSKRFIISNISSYVDGEYFAVNSKIML